MNENENQNIIDDEDMILPDDFEDMPTSEEMIEEEKGEENSQASEQETQNENIDEQKIVDFLNSKEIKYNGESVKIGSLNDFIETFQKGMNYDNLKSKQDVVIGYVAEKARGMGMSVEQYMEKVKEWEEAQKKAKEEESVQIMMSRRSR